jgi:serine phosphatase RsbU (regulator of sigma subunit)
MAIVSRGVVEAESRKAEFGLNGVKNLMKVGPASAKALSREILQGVQDFMHMAPKHNDVTALTITRGA